MYIYIYACVCVCVCVCVCMRVYMCVCMYIFMYVCYFYQNTYMNADKSSAICSYACMHVLSSSGKLIPGSAGVKTQAGQGGSTADAAPTFSSAFQKHCLITRMTLPFCLDNGAKWSVRYF
jgi:hypothetical protein